MMKPTPLVSIVVPAYNCEDYIAECIQIILEQTYPNLQIILVDDGSMDRTYEICSSFLDERITLVRKENGGASSARNVGLEHIDGEYVLFVDSDDYLEKDAVRELVERIQSEDADLIYFEADNFTDEKDIPIKQKGFAQKVDYPPMSGNDLIPLLIKNKDYHAAPFLFFAKQNIYQNGIRFHEGIMMEDELFSFQLFRACNLVVCLRKELYHRRVRSGSVMTSKGKEQFHYVSIQTVFLELLKERENTGDATLEQYLARIGMLVVGYWEQLSKEQKAQLWDQYHAVRKTIRDASGFGDKELLVRTYGKTLWMAYAAPDRLMKRIEKIRK